jgi:hypothetical protein
MSAPQLPVSRNAPRIPAQLPAEIGAFTGRAEHLEWLDRELRSDQTGGSTVIALVGRGGAGKSALAGHAAQRLRDRFPDGQLFADLCGSTIPLDPREVLSGFLSALGVRDRIEPADITKEATLFRTVTAGRRMLIVLDDAADYHQIEPLLPGGSECVVLCTSQCSMAETQGVRTRRIDGLSTPEALQMLSRLIGSERFDRERTSARLIIEICSHLPLAIRAAAARLRIRPTCSLARFADRLADERRRIAELTYGSLDTGARLIAVANRLPPAERSLWLMLSALDVPHISAWLAASLSGVPEDEAQRLLDRLCDHQLLDVVNENHLGSAYYRFYPLTLICARQLAEKELDPRVRAANLATVTDVFCWLEARARHTLAPHSAPGQFGLPPNHVLKLGPGVLFDVTRRAELWLTQERPNLLWLTKAATARALPNDLVMVA